MYFFVHLPILTNGDIVESMDQKTLERLISSHNTARINEQEAYYLGKNPALLAPVAKPAPDYRVPVPFARVAVDNMAGYLVAPGNVQYSGAGYEKLKPIFDANEESIITTNLFKNACKHGIAWEVHWMEEGEPQFAIVPNAQAIPQWSNDIRPKLISFVWYKTVKIEEEAVEIAEVYGLETVERWVKAKNGWARESEEAHGYGKVPVVSYRIDFNGLNLFDHVRDLMDLFDRLISADVANEAARYSNAILALAERLDDESLENLKQLGVLEGLGDGDVKQKIAFITKDIPTAFIEFAATTTERLLYDMLQMPNPNDENFASGSSGIAQAYKLLGFEFKCSSIEAAFLRGLQDRVRMIAGNAAVSGIDGTSVSITLHRNLPFDVQTNAQIAAQLSGVWDLKAILSLFPDKVLSQEDKERILRAKEAERATAMSIFDTTEDDNQDDA